MKLGNSRPYAPLRMLLGPTLAALALVAAPLDIDRAAAGPHQDRAHGAMDHGAMDHHGDMDHGAMAHGAMKHGMVAPDPGASAFERQMYQDMARMMTDMHAPGYTGDEDVDFLAMMIPHHQGAIDMAKLVLLHGDDPLTRQVAEGIIASQQAEIEAMRGRLRALRSGEDPDMDAYPALSGTRGD